MSSLHKFRPKFLGYSDGLPAYYDPYEFKHICHINCKAHGDRIVLTTEDEHFEPYPETNKCLAVPFVSSNHFHSKSVATKLANAIKEV